MLVFVSLPRFFLFLYPLSSVYLLLGSASYLSQLPHLHYLPRAVPLTQGSSLADKEGRLEPNPSLTVEIEQPNTDLSSTRTQIAQRGDLFPTFCHDSWAYFHSAIAEQALTVCRLSLGVTLPSINLRTWMNTYRTRWQVRRVGMSSTC